MAERGSLVDRAQANLGFGALVGLFAAMFVSIASFSAVGMWGFVVFGIVFAVPIVALEWRILGRRRAFLLGSMAAPAAMLTSFLAGNLAYLFGA